MAESQSGGPPTTSRLGHVADWFARAGRGLQQVHISFREFAAVTAGVATVVGSTVVFHPPFTPWVKWITVVYASLALVLFLVGFLAHFRWDESRYEWIRNLHAAVAEIVEVRALDAFLLMIASTALLVVSLSWPAPDRRQIAQQMLNDRGMFLTRQYFKTALEVGNTNGVDLFLEAGFPPSLAVSLFGETAETVPDRRTIDSLFALDEETRHTILGHLASHGDRENDQGDEGERTTSVFNLPMGDGRDGEGEGHRVTRDHGPRMDLLGHALQTDSRTAVEMLRLGADPYLSLGVFFHRSVPTLTLTGAGATVEKRGRLPWKFATDVYRYVSSAAVEEHVGAEAISAMIERGVAPGYCDETGDCEFGGRRIAGKELRKAKCEAELLKNKGRVLIFVYPDTTLRDGRVWAFEPHARGGLCSGRTASYYGTLSNPLTGGQAVGTVRILGREDGNTIYVVESGRGEDTNNAPLLRVLGWSGSAARIWELGNLDRGRGVIVDTRILWSDEELDGTVRPAEAKKECADDGRLPFSGPGSIELSCQHSFSLRSMSEGSDAVFEVTQVGTDRVSQVYWHAADETEVRFAKGTYVIKTRAPRLRAGESLLGVDVQEIALDEGEFGGDYAELPQEVDRKGTIEHGTLLYAGLAVSTATLVSVSLSELERDVDVRLTDSQGKEIDSSINASNADEQIDVLLWPGLYELAIEAIDEGRSEFLLKLSSRVLASSTRAIGRSDRVGAGGRSFEILDVPGVEVVTIGLTGLSENVDIRLFDAEYTEVGSSTNFGDADEEIVVHLWRGQYALEIVGSEGSDYRLDVERRIPELRRLPFEAEGSVGEGEEQSVWFEIHEPTTVKASLSGLSADVDLRIVGKSGELASSINGGDSDEWLEEELPPGEYVLSVYALDTGSDYLLAASDDPEWTGPDANDDGSDPEK